MWSFYLISLLIGISLANETYTDAEARDKLKRVGINVNSERKTSLNGIRVSSVNALLDFKKDSKCKIVITGGTELGHANGDNSHSSGYKFDIKQNICVDDYIKKNCDPSGKRKDGTNLFKCKSGIFAFEKNHWDILFS